MVQSRFLHTAAHPGATAGFGTGSGRAVREQFHGARCRSGGGRRLGAGSRRAVVRPRGRWKQEVGKAAVPGGPAGAAAGGGRHGHRWEHYSNRKLAHVGCMRCTPAEFSRHACAASAEKRLFVGLAQEPTEAAMHMCGKAESTSC